MRRSADQGVLAALHAEGRRITAQRRLLLEIIRQSKGHLDAGEIYRRARKKDPRISLSTVYRNLNLLKELGLISELHLDQEHHHYEVKEETEHYHLICSHCGQVVEFDNPLVDRLIAQVSKEKGFHVERVYIDLVGLCDECRARERNQSPR
ncbi:MAG: transcriptional repressor [Anaerolineae bacterium]|nr:transcriptional repressor [Anaerolineae bacterium]